MGFHKPEAVANMRIIVPYYVAVETGCNAVLCELGVDTWQFPQYYNVDIFILFAIIKRVRPFLRVAPLGIVMPIKNTIKSYVAGGIYHIYNRGIEKRQIFLEEMDYKIFLYYLQSYLVPINQQINPPPGIKGASKFYAKSRNRTFCLCIDANTFSFTT